MPCQVVRLAGTKDRPRPEQANPGAGRFLGVTSFAGMGGGARVTCRAPTCRLAGPPQTTSPQCSDCSRRWARLGLYPLATQAQYAAGDTRAIRHEYELLLPYSSRCVGQPDYDPPPFTRLDGRPPQRSPWPFGAGRLAAVCQGAAGGARWGAGPHVAPVHAAWAAALHFPSGHGHRSSPRPRIALAGWLQRLRSQGQAWGIEPQTRSYLTNALEKADREEHAPVRE